MTNSTFNHLILTRFNVPDRKMNADKTGKKVLTREWMLHRMDLFDRYCLPSVIGQTDQNFKWLVFFDSNTDGEFKERIKRYCAYGQMEAVFVPEMRYCKDEVRKRIPKSTEYLITTRLDNDDSMEKGLIGVVQANFYGQAFVFLNCTQGYYLSNDQVYFVKDYSNPFMSLVEKINGENATAKTVWCASHTDIAKHGKIEQIDDAPRWLRIIHDRNAGDRDPAKKDMFGNVIKPIAKRVLRSIGIVKGGIPAEGMEKLTNLKIIDLKPMFSLE